ncbi:unnamed protein product [Soboliphyme baturini]|uniref:BACK domain-containing protein n=1 Tax=Soboliphyme baturini TaxID=241478 RepID=A0A183II00_9BILA|nr:unnamed protein product [Soboliphyme baturini]
MGSAESKSSGDAFSWTDRHGSSSTNSLFEAALAALCHEDVADQNKKKPDNEEGKICRSSEAALGELGSSFSTPSSISDDPTTILKKILCYIEHGDVEITLDELPGLISVARYLGFAEFVTYIEERLVKASRNLNILGKCIAISYFCCASEGVKNVLLSKVVENLTKEVVKQQIPMLPTAAIFEFLKRDDVRYKCKQGTMLLDIVLRWMDANRYAASFFPLILNCIRFDHVSSDEAFQYLDEAENKDLADVLLPNIAAAEWKRLCINMGRAEYAQLNLDKCPPPTMPRCDEEATEVSLFP